ncbi:MAG: hypothetical protein RI568_04620 [Natronomonas sp.]|uniref:hypothetical protein n=1 Tax=Natronomonas sp. TaxID=2184060 RepID=UPI0028704479|nr:hypothetical protein [Natronomonas sp.]MDR9429972.1 hypothetical protein [Natronomonas sp.]
MIATRADARARSPPELFFRVPDGSPSVGAQPPVVASASVSAMGMSATSYSSKKASRKSRSVDPSKVYSKLCLPISVLTWLVHRTSTVVCVLDARREIAVVPCRNVRAKRIARERVPGGLERPRTAAETGRRRDRGTAQRPRAAVSLPKLDDRGYTYATIETDDSAVTAIWE